MPRSCATVLRREKLTDLGLSLAIGLQRGVKYLSAVHPMACSEWGSCFDRFLISDFGGKWPLKWNFSKKIFRILRWNTEVRFMNKFGENWLLRSCQKVVGLPHKKTRALGTRPSPHFAQNWPIATKITWTLSPFDLSTYTEFGPDRLHFAGLIPVSLIFRPKNSIQYPAFSHRPLKIF